MNIRLIRILLGVGLFCGLAACVYLLSLSVFRLHGITAAEGRLSLYRGTLLAEIGRFSHLPYVLAGDPFVVDGAEGRNLGQLNRRLARFADRAGLDAIYLMDAEGLTLAASNYRQPTSFVGRNYGFRPYFKDALKGRQGLFYGIGATTRQPGYFIAEAVRGTSGTVIGVIAVKVDLESLEATWADGGEHVFVANQDGIVLLASDPAWRYKTLKEISNARREEIAAGRQFGDELLARLDWRLLETGEVRLASETYLHLKIADLPHGWTLHYMADPRPAKTRAWMVVIGLVVLGAAISVFLLLRRNRHIGHALRRSEAEEAELRSANIKLAHEISERKAAEAALTRTQDELARASRLAALGQLAASVTHELGQPISALRNHLMAAEISSRPESLQTLPGKLGTIVERMEAITRQLKFFASPAAPEMQPVDLREVLEGALSLIGPDISGNGIEFTTAVADTPVVVRGNRIRLEQVATNLIRNALNAMNAMEVESGDRIEMSVSQEAETAVLSVLDRGPGLGGSSLAELQEPFVTSQASGDGMGLGLAISAEIMREHSGELDASDREEGGACFKMTLPLLDAGEPT